MRGHGREFRQKRDPGVLHHHDEAAQDTTVMTR